LINLVDSRAITVAFAAYHIKYNEFCCIIQNCDRKTWKEGIIRKT